jgi:hypothetical protein
MFEKGQYLITAEDLAFYDTYQNTRVIVDPAQGRK